MEVRQSIYGQSVKEIPVDGSLKMILQRKGSRKVGASNKIIFYIILLKFITYFSYFLAYSNENLMLHQI